MIVNPIIPIWLMLIICLILIILVIYNKQLKNIIAAKSVRKKELLKHYIVNACIKLGIITLLFIVNLRFMIPNGESNSINSDLSILFVIDTSVSMKALDYDGNKERFEGVVNDCCYIVDELANCKFSIITFGNTAQKVVPFTNDTDMVQAELRAITLENDFYAKGTSMNLVKETFEKTLEKDSKRQNGKSKYIVFFISDGEITKEDENLESFSNISQYVSNGAVLGYGTKEPGGKMIRSAYENDPSSLFYYITYNDENYNTVTAISKMDENNLQKIASDLKIDYIPMNKTSNIDYKLNELKQEMYNSQTSEQKISSYKDIYYYFVIPLAILLIVDFILKKRRIQ